MDILSLHALLRSRGFHYFSGNTNDHSGDIHMTFSTSHNGRGNYISIRLGENDNDIEVFMNGTKTFKAEGIDDNRLYLNIHQNTSKR